MRYRVCSAPGVRRPARRGWRRQDRVIMRALPFDAAPRRVAGISREVIDQVLEKHGLLGAVDPERIVEKG